MNSFALVMNFETYYHYMAFDIAINQFSHLFLQSRMLLILNLGCLSHLLLHYNLAELESLDMFPNSFLLIGHLLCFLNKELIIILPILNYHDLLYFQFILLIFLMKKIYLGFHYFQFILLIFIMIHFIFLLLQFPNIYQIINFLNHQ